MMKNKKGRVTETVCRNFDIMSGKEVQIKIRHGEKTRIMIIIRIKAIIWKGEARRKYCDNIVFNREASPPCRKCLC